MAGEISQAMQVMPNMQANFGTGMATGYQAGHQMDVANNLLDLGTQGAQMNNDAQAMNLTQQYNNQPLLNTQRDVAMGTAKDELAQQNEGIPQAVARSNAAGKIASNDATILSTQDKKKLAVGNAATEVDNVLGSQTSLPLANQQMIRQKFAAFGLTLPTDPTEARDMIKQYADWNANTGEKLKAKAAQASQEAIAKIGYDKTVDAARIRAENQLDLAKNKIAALKSLDPKTQDALITKWTEKKAQGTITPEENEQLVRLQTIQILKSPATTSEKVVPFGVKTEPTPNETAKTAIMTGAKLPGSETPAATAPTQGKQYSPAAEAMIAKGMSMNKGATREQIIELMKKNGKL